ncbi:MAG TPA: Gfo/Idh/MocA family oxidoreductase, partial [Steroidobacteraceae bacterium]|nr:Gfo/Idh/MocA family oxidoreductase [Steroidobacteraceae bacterium]
DTAIELESADSPDSALRVGAASASRPRARLGFLGVGWIGLSRMRAVVQAGAAEVVCIADAAPESAARAAQAALTSMQSAPRTVAGLEALLEEEIDGLVIATPSGQHAPQAIAALTRGLTVFCQKPLATTAAEAARVVAVARALDRLIDVDFCYRTVAGVPQLAGLVRCGALGEVFAADLTFHNAYGPDKSWFYDRRQSGGGCVMDLGIHLVDLLLWALDFPEVVDVRSRLYAEGRPLEQPALEDYATAELCLASGAVARLACSWRLPAGRDAVIEAAFYGTRGAAILRNVNGSFYEFTVEHCEGTRRRLLAGPPDDWGGRAICAWARRMTENAAFDPAAERLVSVSAVIDRIYAR